MRVLEQGLRGNLWGTSISSSLEPRPVLLGRSACRRPRWALSASFGPRSEWDSSFLATSAFALAAGRLATAPAFSAFASFSLAAAACSTVELLRGDRDYWVEASGVGELSHLVPALGVVRAIAGLRLAIRATQRYHNSVY